MNKSGFTGSKTPPINFISSHFLWWGFYCPLICDKIVIVTGGASGIGEATGIELAKEKVDSLTDLHPIGRLGVAIEVAKVIPFLASDDASFISGVTLPIDGEYTSM